MIVDLDDLETITLTDEDLLLVRLGNLADLDAVSLERFAAELRRVLPDGARFLVVDRSVALEAVPLDHLRALLADRQDPPGVAP